LEILVQNKVLLFSAEIAECRVDLQDFAGVNTSWHQLEQF
jgi:hypothetical protein